MAKKKNQTSWWVTPLVFFIVSVGLFLLSHLDYCDLLNVCDWWNVFCHLGCGTRATTFRTVLFWGSIAVFGSGIFRLIKGGKK